MSIASLDSLTNGSKLNLNANLLNKEFKHNQDVKYLDKNGISRFSNGLSGFCISGVF